MSTIVSASELSRASVMASPSPSRSGCGSIQSLNDTHGHAAGDVALRSLSAILRQSFRQSDTVGRYGGEEFVVLLPETDIEAAHQKLESVRATIASSPINLLSGAT